MTSSTRLPYSSAIISTNNTFMLMIIYFLILICNINAFIHHITIPSSRVVHRHHHDVSTTTTTYSNKSFKSNILFSSSSANNDNMPTMDEISQQKSEAYNALSSYHETSKSLTTSSSTQIQSLLRGLDTIGMESVTELEQQNNIAEYWTCKKGAITYPITIDRSQGLKKGIISKPYNCSVQFEMELGDLVSKSNSNSNGRRRRKKGLRLVESIQFINDEEGMASPPFVRSIPMDENVDVDSADGSYSLIDEDISTTEKEGEEEEEEEAPCMPLLPPSLLCGISNVPTYVIENTLAMSDMERCRCFLLYGNDEMLNDDEEEEEVVEKKIRKEKNSKGSNNRSYVLTGVILAEETKVMPTQEEQKKNDDTEEDDYAADFISQMIETDTPAAATTTSNSSPLDLLAIDQEEDSKDDKLNRLMKSIDKHNQRVMDSAGGGTDGNTDIANAKRMEMTSIGMFGLVSGVWLGDGFIREHISPELYRARLTRDQKKKTKGFGSKKSDSERDNEDEEDMFATWFMGVQKVALLFSWDYHKSITQSYTWGKCLGTPTSFSSMANLKSDGIVVVNEGRRTKKREEKRTIFDIDGGQYVGGLIGSVYFKAPRYMAFSPTKEYSAEAWVTELLVFSQPVKGDDEVKIRKKSLDALAEEEVIPENYCSRIARLIANDGSLLQGSTAFFSLKQALVDE